MKVYADTPGRRTWQLATDVLAVAWLWFWIWLAMKLYQLVEQLAAPGRKLAGAGDGMANGLADAGAKVHRVPVAGDSLAEPFGKAADAARSLAAAGREEQQAVHQLAWALALLLLLVPVAVVLLWLARRVRWVRRASAAVRIHNDDLLALRALAHQPLRRLSTLDMEAWRQGDPETVAALADLELRRLGLRYRRRRTSSTVDGPGG
jgi:hypothetical protein